MPPFADWAHDVTLAWLLLVVAGSGRPWERWTRLRGLVALGALIAIWPQVGDPVTVALAILALSLLLFDDRSGDTMGPMLLLAAVAIFGRLGATGGPLCDPDSILQPHALWHIGAATAVTWWALRRHPRPAPFRSGPDRIRSGGDAIDEM
jgi:hypothetical protein